jgi:polyamine oxidase
VSVGVLQNSLQFIPELPFWKKESIFVHEMATYTKIFLKFEHAFWDENEFFIYSSPKRGLYTYWQNFNHSKYFPGSNVIMVTLTTQWARRIELQPKEVTISQIMTVLREMYGNDENPDYPPFPIAYEIPIWYQNEFTFGSYSNWPIGMTPRQKNNLGLNVESTLFFAGEAVNEYSGYVHGAYLSGIDAADELLQLMKVEELI